MRHILTVSALLALCAGTASAATPLGGLAVATTGAGDRLVAAGDNRTLYVIDPVKMESTARKWIGVCVVDLRFSKDGSRLLVQDTDGAIHLFDTATWEKIKQQDKADLMAPATDLNLVAALNTDWQAPSINVYSMSDLAEKGKIALTKGDRVSGFALNGDGTKIAVLLDPADDPAETKAQPDAKLKGLEMEEARLKSDGKTSRYMVFNVADGAKVAEHKLWYSSYGGSWRLAWQGETVLLMNYSNLNAAVTSAGDVKLFQLGNSFNYGLAISSDRKTILSGGLAEGCVTPIADTAQGVKFNPDRLPGWPEYFKGFTMADDGTAYASTSGYRIIRLKAGGVFDKSFPVN